MSGPALQSIAPISRCLFSWDAADRSLVARTGQQLSFERTSVGLAYDSRSKYYQATRGQPRWVMDDDATTSTFDSNGLLLEGSRTQRSLWNRDLTNAAWVKTSATPAKTQTGIDGTTNGASSLTATGANGTCIQTVNSGATNAMFSAFVKRLTGTGTVQMTLNNGTNWTTITLTTSWQRFTIGPVSNATRQFGFRLVTSGDAIAVDMTMHEDGNFASWPVTATTVAVTRSLDTLSTTLPVLTSLPNDLTIAVGFHRAGWTDSAIDLSTEQHCLSLGALAGSKIGLYADNASRIFAFYVVDGAAGTQSVNVAIPAGNMLRVSGQVRNLSTGPSVALDVGSGLSSFSPAAAALPTLSSDLLTIGDAVQGPGNVLNSSLAFLKIKAGLHSRAAILADY